MGEFIFNRGRSRTHHSYPDTRQSGGAVLLSLARNYAFGPAGENTPTVDTSPGTEINWGSVDVPGSSASDVPITPRVSGIIMVRGVISLHNTALSNPVDVQIQIEIGTATPTPYAVPASEKVTVPSDDGEGAEGFMTLPFSVQIPDLPIGTTQIVRVLLTADETNLVEIVINSSTIEVQEVLASTG